MPPATVNDVAQSAISNRSDRADEDRLTISKLVENRAAELYGDERAREFASALITASERNNKIKSCKPSSVITAMMACIMLDLMPETSQQFAYLIPYKDSIQFQIGYKGLIELAYRSGMVVSINAELVFSDDEKFEFSLGTNRHIDHIPNMERDRTDLSEATHVYATAILTNGATVFDVMSMSEINKIRETVKAKSTDAPWKTWPEQMAKKTVIKRLMKYLPQSRKDNRAQQAALWDSWAEAGKLDYKDGKIIEGKPVSTELTDPPRRQLKALAKPSDNTEPVVEPENSDENMDFIPQESEQEESTKDVMDDIQDILSFLKLSEREKMRIVNENAHTPLLEKANHKELLAIQKDLKEIADAKTEALAEKEDVEQN